MLSIMDIVQGLTGTILTSTGFTSPQTSSLPPEIVTAVEACSFFESIPLWAVTLIGSLFIWILSFVMILTVYGRFFRLYMYTAIAPRPLSSFAGEPTQNIGISFVKSYAGVCLEGAVIVIACIIFSAISKVLFFFLFWTSADIFAPGKSLQVGSYCCISAVLAYIIILFHGSIPLQDQQHIPGLFLYSWNICLFLR